MYTDPVVVVLLSAAKPGLIRPNCAPYLLVELFLLYEEVVGLTVMAPLFPVIQLVLNFKGTAPPE